MDPLTHLKNEVSRLFIERRKSLGYKGALLQFFNDLINKRSIYIVASILTPVTLFFASRYATTVSSLIIISFALTATILVAIVALALLSRVRGFAFIYFLIPVSYLVLGVLFSLYFFPNLGYLIKMASFIGLGFVVYALSLVNNIFVVVEEKQSVIPLYSAGLAWVQIILILIAIPFYSGIYKVPANFVVQNILLFFSTFSFYIYMHWAVNLDKDLIKTPLKEKGSLAFVLSLLPVVLNTGLLFYPVEAFLKGIFSSTVLLSGLIYIQAHYKNRINSKLLYNYFVLGSIFYIILFIFKP